MLNGGIIGGRDQSGPWKIDTRFNRLELIFRIESIAKLGSRIHLTRMDAMKFLIAKSSEWPAKALIYLDPPYFEQGRNLYDDFYQPKDHEEIHQMLTGPFHAKRWVISYDDVKPIRQLYRNQPRLVYEVGHSTRYARRGFEVMFFSDSVQKSPVSGPLKLTERFS